MIDFDSVLDQIGDFGKYQILVMIPIIYYQVPGGLNSIAPVFLSYKPDFRCLVYPFDNSTIFPNLTDAEIVNITTPTDGQGNPADSCVRYSYSTAKCAEKMDLSCVNISSPTNPCNTYRFNDSLFTETTVTEFELVCNRKILDGISTSAYLVGVLVSSVSIGYFLDRFGRRKPTILFSYGMLLSMLLTAYSPSLAVFIVGRFLVAFFTFGSHMGVFCHVIEIVGTRWRMLVGVLYHSAYCVGYMLWSPIAYLYRDWHRMQLACLIVSAPFVLMMMIVPESPRWLYAKGHLKKGEKIVKMIARMNNRPVPKIPAAEENDYSGSVEEKFQDDEIVKYSTLDLFRYPGLRISTLKIGFFSMVNNTVYYGIAYNMGNLSGNIFLNNIYGGLLEIAGNVICLGIVQFTGRPKLMSGAIGGAGLLLIGTGALSQLAGSNEVLSVIIVVFMVLARGLISGSTAVYCCYVVEFYPTFIRGNGIGFTSTMARVGSITSPFLISIGKQNLLWVPDTVLGVSCLIASIVAMTLPDTTNVPMMDTIQEAESFIGNHRYGSKRRGQYSALD